MVSSISSRVTESCRCQSDVFVHFMDTYLGCMGCMDEGDEFVALTSGDGSMNSETISWSSEAVFGLL